MCNQPRTIDYTARAARFVEDVPDHVVDEVLARLQALVE
jgi:mRNA-degrading endonuclease toxin of MazEF toxin-antitoxin module